MTSPARLRILHVSQPTEAGVAQCVLDFAAGQVRAGHDVHVACPTAGWLSARTAGAGAEVHDWPAVRSPGAGVPLETARLRRLVADVAPDLVHLHAAKAGLAGRLAVRGRTPTVFQPHAWSFDAVKGPVRTATLAWERAAVRWTSVLVCVSVAERVRGRSAGVHVTPTAVVPNGVDLAAFPPAEAATREMARRELSLPLAAPLCVCVGRLTRQKGQDVLLAAWPQVTDAVPTARLVLVGGGPAEDELRRISPPDVVFAGHRSDANTWLRAADVVAAPSRWEGMALVPLEAMATARSLVVSDATGMREMLADGAGAIVPVGAVDELAAALTERLERRVDPDEEGRVGRRAVELHHDLEATLKALGAAYAEAVG